MKLKMKQLRKQAHLNQNELATRAGINLRTYQSWEREENAISLEGACMIAEVLNCSLDELAGREPMGQTYSDDRLNGIAAAFTRLDEQEKNAAYAAIRGIAAMSCAQDEGPGDYGTERRKGA